MPIFFNSRHIALLLISTALLAYQIGLLQILATSQWHHFAYMVISIALLGFGASGTVLALFRSCFLIHQQHILPLLFSGCAVTLGGALGVIQYLFGGFDSYLLFVDPYESLRLALSALILALPFFCGALAIGIILISGGTSIGSYYCANMLGSGIGCILGLAGLASMSPESIPPWCGLFSFGAALVLLSRPAGKIHVVCLLCILPVITFLLSPPVLGLSQYKDLRRSLNLPGAEVIAKRPSADGQVHVVHAPAMRSASGLSLNWHAELPTSTAVFINGGSIGHLPAVNGSNPRQATTFALPYALRTPATVLVLNAGTAQEVALAISKGAESITAIEPHRALYDVLKEILKNEEEIFSNDGVVAWHNVSPRTWLARDPRHYDLIILPSLGSIGGNAGLFALQEQPLFTKEAIMLALEKLSPDGMLAVTTWVDYPVRSPLRLTATLVETLEALGKDPARHIAAIRSWGTLTICIKKSEITDPDMQAIRSFAEQWAFDLALPPGISANERQKYNILQDASLFELLDKLFDREKRKELYSEYPFRINPLSDDRPFFTQFMRWSRISILIRHFGQHSVPFVELGSLIAGVTALVLTILAVCLILLPLMKIHGTSRSRWQTFFYFGGLGIGYMWTELALIHRFEFYIGHPVQATALVVAVLLIGSAFGSLVSDRFLHFKPGRFAATICVLLIVCALFLEPILSHTLQHNLYLRSLIGGLLLCPVAIIMGMPFPLGLRSLDITSKSEVPWAWGINGCLSVVGAAFATLLAVEIGYMSLLLLAAVAYLLAASMRLQPPA